MEMWRLKLKNIKNIFKRYLESVNIQKTSLKNSEAPEITTVEVNQAIYSLGKK